jgi:hypothetical protein
VTDRAYPIRPQSDADPRFIFGLTHDVANVLKDHGYPPISHGLDFVDLQQALFKFLYGSTDPEAAS